MIIDIIVLSSLGLALIFLLAWGMHSELRARVEKPKYLFQQQVNNFEKHNQQLTEASGSQKVNKVKDQRE